MKFIGRFIVIAIAGAFLGVGCGESEVSSGSGADLAVDSIEQEITETMDLPEGSITSGGNTEIPMSETDLAESSDF